MHITKWKQPIWKDCILYDWLDGIPQRERAVETVETSALRRLGRGWNESERPERMTATPWADIDGAAVPFHRQAVWMAAIVKRNWWCCVASENRRGCKSETALKKEVKYKWRSSCSYRYCVQRINEGLVDGFDQVPWTALIRLNHLKFWNPLTVLLNFLGFDLIHQTLEIIDDSAK